MRFLFVQQSWMPLCSISRGEIWIFETELEQNPVEANRSKKKLPFRFRHSNRWRKKKKFQLTLKFIYRSGNRFTFLLRDLRRSHVENETRKLFVQICAKINRKQWTKRRHSNVWLIQTHIRGCYRLSSHKLWWPMAILISRRWLLSANEVNRSHMAIGCNSQ